VSREQRTTLRDPYLLDCEACGARVPALRRGRCPTCYLRWSDARPVGLGAACVVCGERRRENLRSVEFQRRWVPMCHNCSSKTFRLQPIPRTIEALRERFSRDRRWRERRVGRRDNRLFQGERRVGERREEFGLSADQLLDATDLVIEIFDEQAGSDATRIAPDGHERRSSREGIGEVGRQARLATELQTTGPHPLPVRPERPEPTSGEIGG
jgi:hypothetical protein